MDKRVWLRWLAVPLLLLSAFLFIGVNMQHARALNNGLALTPPMGWNSWNHFQCDATEATIKQAADAMVSSGMKAAGYQYVNVDCGWKAGSRDSDGNLVADSNKFPDGMKALADYVHNDGLKFGLYTDVGPRDCVSDQPGSLDHEQQDANLFASWGVDYLKEDWCNADGLDAQTQYGKMRDALANTGRPIVFSICNGWDTNQTPWTWGPSTGNLWRTTNDIADNWNSMLSNFDQNAQHASSAGPGAWNDPDMLEVGNGGMSDTEYRSEFSMWAISAAPLIAGNDLTNMSSSTLSILTNGDVIAVDQDPAGIQGTLVSDNGSGLQVWSKKLQGSGQYAVALFNRSDSAANITVNWSDLGLTTGSASVRDLWSHTDLGSISGGYTANVPSHGVVMLKVSGTQAATTSYEAESSANTLGGGALIRDCSVCSGGKNVGNVGNGGTLTFNGISANTSGSTSVTIYYINGDSGDRTAQMSVNGGAATTVSFPSTGNWQNQVVGSITVSVTLNAGSSNTIEFSNSSAWAPDFDRIVVASSSSSTPTPAPTATPTPTSTPTSGALVIAINAGGGASGSFVADTDVDQGNQYSDTSSSVNTSGVSNPAPQAVYQTCHWNASFTYTIPNLTAGKSYTVRLHWAELTFQATGSRVFNVAINGSTVLSNFDVYATAGYKKALVKSFTATANSSGQIVIAFTQAGADNPFINGIEVLTA